MRHTFSLSLSAGSVFPCFHMRSWLSILNSIWQRTCRPTVRTAGTVSASVQIKLVEIGFVLEKDYWRRTALCLTVALGEVPDQGQIQGLGNPAVVPKTKKWDRTLYFGGGTRI